MLLLNRVEQFLKSHQMSPTQFGRRAVKDPHFVKDLRQGRCVGHRLAARVITFLEGAAQ